MSFRFRRAVRHVFLRHQSHHGSRRAGSDGQKVLLRVKRYHCYTSEPRGGQKRSHFRGRLFRFVTVMRRKRSA